MSDRTALKAAYRRFANNERVRPEELQRPVETIVRISRRMSAASWLNTVARDRRAAAAAPAGWERRAMLNAAYTCLQYAGTMRETLVRS